ncbi:MAG: ATP-binding protein [Planctomycetota bacterium]
MDVIESTKLWQKTLGSKDKRKYNDLERRFIERLRNSFMGFRSRAKTVCAEIPRSFRDLTVHDIEHIDALWQCADLVLGEDYSINPLETYVLGGAFLLHDLGLALSSYAGGSSEVEQTALWKDAAAFSFKKNEGRTIRADDWDSLNEKVRQDANEMFLRLNHARHAARLSEIEYRAGSSDAPGFLIEDSELRESFGHTIGTIAYSHWWHAEEVVEKLDKRTGGFPGGPTSWDVDSLKLAFLVRVADAIQIDSRRAPTLLRSLRKPCGIADNHWRFQNLVNSPTVDRGAIAFTSKRPFTPDEAEPWWTGKGLLELADRELRDADNYLTDNGRDALRVHRVAGVQRQHELTRLMQVCGWTPVETKIHVSDVVSVVNTLGGQGLYGRDPRVALRELLQNARDAVVARRLKEHRSPDWGEIRVSLEKNADAWVLSVQDNGVGMSTATLSGPLLDFGQSYWQTDHMLFDHPQLAASGFEPNGKYGIGFFSVFTVASEVVVTTRSPEAGNTATQVMEFSNGVAGRVIIRDANESERLLEPGTVVQLQLKRDPYEEGGVLGPGFFWPRTKINSSYHREKQWKLSDLCRWLAPALDVNLVTAEAGLQEDTITANDWKTIEGVDLLHRLVLYRDDHESLREGDRFQKIGRMLTDLTDSTGETVGRGTITSHVMLDSDEDDLFGNKPTRRHDSFGRCPSIVTAGQFRSSESVYLCGLFIGDPLKASRGAAEPKAFRDSDALVQWASIQSSKVAMLSDDPWMQQDFAAIIRNFGGNTGDLLIFRRSDGYKSFNDIVSMDLPDRVELIQDAWGVAGFHEFELSASQLAVSIGKMRKRHDWQFEADPQERADHPVWSRFWMSPWGAAIEAVAKSWGVPLQSVLESSDFDHDKHIDEDGNKRHLVTSDTLKKPTG